MCFGKGLVPAIQGADQLLEFIIQFDALPYALDDPLAGLPQPQAPPLQTLCSRLTHAVLATSSKNTQTDDVLHIAGHDGHIDHLRRPEALDRFYGQQCSLLEVDGLLDPFLDASEGDKRVSVFQEGVGEIDDRWHTLPGWLRLWRMFPPEIG